MPTKLERDSKGKFIKEKSAETVLLEHLYRKEQRRKYFWRCVVESFQIITFLIGVGCIVTILIIVISNVSGALQNKWNAIGVRPYTDVQLYFSGNIPASEQVYIDGQNIPIIINNDRYDGNLMIGPATTSCEFYISRKPPNIICP